MPFFIDPPPPFLRMGTRTPPPGVDITLLMTQGIGVGVIYLGGTDASSPYRSVPFDEIRHTGRLPFSSP